MKLSSRYAYIIDYFQKNMPKAETELRYSSPYELIVAVILSAQCTDKRVNQITPALFFQFPSFNSLALAKNDEVFALIRSCSYPNNKTRNLIAMAIYVRDQLKGSLPQEIEELQKIPGVGRKTANVLASVLFKKPAMAVDTHVFRVSARLGLTKNAKNPLECEKQLTKNFPPELIPDAHHWLILHGRYVCKARNPLCNSCGLREVCNYFHSQKNSKGK